MNWGINLIIQIIYLLVACSFIYGLKRMSSPKTARNGIVVAGIAMVAATLITFASPEVSFYSTTNLTLIIVAIAVGSVLAYVSGRTVQMTNMPQMIALYNGMGGGAAAAIAAIELIKVTAHGHRPETVTLVLAILGAIIGMVSFTGSFIAFTKLQGWFERTFLFKGQRLFNVVLFVLMLVLGGYMMLDSATPQALIAFLVVAGLFGIFVTIPIGGADMPVVISLYNAMTGLAVAFEGFVLQNPAMIIAGTVVGAAGTLLTQLMAKAMNRPISNVLFGSIGTGGGGGTMEGELKEASPDDAAAVMAYANQVIIVPGYGMAVAQAQHKIAELAKVLESNGVAVKFAIHPVAGRMPGHMNVLLAEAGIEYDKIFDLEEINSDFLVSDVALVIGANDVVNPAAKNDTDSPIYGMPILDAELAKTVYVIKRGKGKGFSGVENTLFYNDNTRMIYGDGTAVVTAILNSAKSLID